MPFLDPTNERYLVAVQKTMEKIAVSAEKSDTSLLPISTDLPSVYCRWLTE